MAKAEAGRTTVRYASEGFSEAKRKALLVKTKPK